MKQPINQSYPCRLGSERRGRITRAVGETGLTFPETIRQAIDFGLPILLKKLRKKK